MVQITSSFVATVLLVAPAILAAPVSQESFEAREPVSGSRIAGGLSRVSGRVHSLHEASHRPSAHRLSHDSATGSHRLRTSSVGLRRPAPLNLGGGSKRLGGREAVEEIDELSAREPLSGRLSSGALSSSRRLTGLRSPRLSSSHSESHRTHSAGVRALGRRPTGLGSPRLGSSRRLGGREDIEDVEELAAREPFSGRRPLSGGLSPSLRTSGLSHRLGSIHSAGVHGLGRRPTGLASPRFGGSRRLGGREDIEDVEEFAAREPFSGRRPLSGGLSPSLRSSGLSHRLGPVRSAGVHGLGRRPTGLGSPRFGGSRRLGGREEVEEELAAREPEPLKTPVSALGRISPSLRPHSAGSKASGSIRAHSTTSRTLRPGSLKPHTRLAHGLSGGKVGAGHIGALNHRVSNTRLTGASHRLGGPKLSSGSKGLRRLATREDVEELLSRDVEDFEEFSERDLEEIEELAARDPSVKEWFENIGKKIKHFFVGKKPATTPAPAADSAAAEAPVAARSEDVEMADLLEREVDLD
jgi:hypothetical protein